MLLSELLIVIVDWKIIAYEIAIYVYIYISENGTPSPLIVTAGQALWTGRSWNARLIVSPRGRYLAAKSEADHYMRELNREQEEIITVPDTGKCS